MSESTKSIEKIKPKRQIWLASRGLDSLAVVHFTVDNRCTVKCNATAPAAVQVHATAHFTGRRSLLSVLCRIPVSPFRSSERRAGNCTRADAPRTQLQHIPRREGLVHFEKTTRTSLSGGLWREREREREERPRRADAASTG